MPDHTTPENVREILDGGIDLHVHTFPDIFPRRIDDHEAAREAGEAGLAGLVLKSHFFPTEERAALAQKHTGVRTFGGIVLNKCVGGINPYAAETALQAGAAVVWMPTVHSVNTVTRPEIVAMFQTVIRPGEKGIAVVENGAPAEGVIETLEVIKARGAALATGHIYAGEVTALVRWAVDMNLPKIILTHPFSSLIRMTVEEVKELTRLSDAVFVEFTCFDCCDHIQQPLTLEQVAAFISQVGPERAILTSDGGQTYNPRPVEMLAHMIGYLMTGFNRRDLRKMVVNNPAHLLGLA